MHEAEIAEGCLEFCLKFRHAFWGAKLRMGAANCSIGHERG